MQPLSDPGGALEHELHAGGYFAGVGWGQTIQLLFSKDPPLAGGLLEGGWWV